MINKKVTPMSIAARNKKSSIEICQENMIEMINAEILKIAADDKASYKIHLTFGDAACCKLPSSAIIEIVNLYIAEGYVAQYYPISGEYFTIAIQW